jgi:rod shape determining protein RodA
MERRLWREPTFDLMGKVLRINWPYVLLLCALAAVGYTALFSAGGGSGEPFATRHAMRFAFGLVIMVGIAMVDIRFIARLAWPAWVGSVVLLVLVLRMGHVGKGAQRWLDLGGLQVQPSEMMKLALVLALASWFHRASWERMGNPLFLVPPALAVLIPVGLILKEPNLGTAAITALLGVAMSILFSIPRAIRSAPATTSSSQKSRWARAEYGARVSCKAPRVTLIFSRRSRPISSSPRSARNSGWSAVWP